MDNLSIVFQTIKNLGQKNDPYDVIWVEMDYIDNPRCDTFQLVRIRHGQRDFELHWEELYQEKIRIEGM